MLDKDVKNTILVYNYATDGMPIWHPIHDGCKHPRLDCDTFGHSSTINILVEHYEKTRYVRLGSFEKIANRERFTAIDADSRYEKLIAWSYPTIILKHPDLSNEYRFITHQWEKHGKEGLWLNMLTNEHAYARVI